MNETYLFEFDFRKCTISAHICDWMKETRTDYFRHRESIYADIYGCGEYYRIVTEHVGNGVFEVYADISHVVKHSGLDRLYPMVSKAVPVQAPFRKIIVMFPDGDVVFTEIRSCSKEAKAFYMGNPMKTQNGIMYADRVEILA